MLLTRKIFVDEKHGEKLQICVQVFIADIELQEFTHAEGKPCILYCDMTEADLQKRLLERRFNVSKSNFHIFTSLEANKFRQVLKLQNPSVISQKRLSFTTRQYNLIVCVRRFSRCKLGHKISP